MGFFTNRKHHPHSIVVIHAWTFYKTRECLLLARRNSVDILIHPVSSVLMMLTKSKATSSHHSTERQLARLNSHRTSVYIEPMCIWSARFVAELANAAEAA